MMLSNENSSIDLSASKQVPMMYAGEPDRYGSDYEWRTLQLVPLVIAISGALHCIGWSRQTPITLAEIVLWRLFSLGLLASFIGLIAGIFAHYLVSEQKLRFEGKTRQEASKFGLVFHTLVIPALVLYYISRIGLVVLALLELRAFTDRSYGQVHWTTPLPHVKSLS
jgi:uncharacterized membrane protein